MRTLDDAFCGLFGWKNGIPCVGDNTGTRLRFSDAVQVVLEGSPSAVLADMAARTFVRAEVAKAARDIDPDDSAEVSPSRDLAEEDAWEVGRSVVARGHRQFAHSRARGPDRWRRPWYLMDGSGMCGYERKVAAAEVKLDELRAGQG